MLDATNMRSFSNQLKLLLLYTKYQRRQNMSSAFVDRRGFQFLIMSKVHHGVEHLACVKHAIHLFSSLISFIQVYMFFITLITTFTINLFH